MDKAKASSSSNVADDAAAAAAEAAAFRSRLDSRRNKVDIFPVNPLTACRGGCVTKFSGTPPPPLLLLLLNGVGGGGGGGCCCCCCDDTPLRDVLLPMESIALEMASSVPSTAPGLASLLLTLDGAVDLPRRNRRAGMLVVWYIKEKESYYR
jgi:hypothetical protein